jgi:hypothetical protein
MALEAKEALQKANDKGAEGLVKDATDDVFKSKGGDPRKPPNEEELKKEAELKGI